MKNRNSRRIPQEWWDDYCKQRRKNRIHSAFSILIPAIVWILYILLVKFGYVIPS